MPKTNLMRKGTAGRDCSPKAHQKSLLQPADKPQGVEYTGLGTPLKGGKPPEATTPNSTVGTGSLDPAMFNVDGHAVRAFSRYMEGKRAGPDWLHRRVEAAEEARFQDGLGMLRRS